MSVNPVTKIEPKNLLVTEKTPTSFIDGVKRAIYSIDGEEFVRLLPTIADSIGRISHTEFRMISF